MLVGLPPPNATAARRPLPADRCRAPIFSPRSSYLLRVAVPGIRISMSDACSSLRSRRCIELCCPRVLHHAPTPVPPSVYGSSLTQS